MTHLFNATSGVGHRDGGSATLAWEDYAEIIPEHLHVDRAAFKLARRAVSGLYSVTDATAASGMPDGRYAPGSQSVEKCDGRVLLADGTLAQDMRISRIGAGALAGWLEIRDDEPVALWRAGTRHPWA